MRLCAKRLPASVIDPTDGANRSASSKIMEELACAIPSDV